MEDARLPPLTLNQFGRRMVELLPQMIRGFAQRESNYLSRGKITLPQLWVLEFLSRQGISRMNELARFLRISRPAATSLADRLISQGLVDRAGDARDRRVVQLSLTPKGKRILGEIWDEKRRMLLQVFGQIPTVDRFQYLRTLERVVAILSREGR